jgi:hypothetical protein
MGGEMKMHNGKGEKVATGLREVRIAKRAGSKDILDWAIIVNARLK